MRESSATVVNKLGLHARAAARLVQEAGHFACRIRVRHNREWVDAKSIMSVMMLAASQGSVLELQTDGPDEDEALDALLTLIANRFDEAE